MKCERTIKEQYMAVQRQHRVMRTKKRMNKGSGG
jgi:hypothetical protein